MSKERKRKPKITYDSDYFKRLAAHFSHRHKLTDYESGRKATEILLGISDNNFDVVEIGPGPGTVTVPLSRSVKRIVGVEVSEMNIKYLLANLKGNGLKNIEIIHKDWGKVNDDEIKEKFDLVVCSHFLWQIEDIEVLLERMENASKRYCVIIQPSGRDELVKEIFEKVSKQKYISQFEPDADYFAYVIVREWGRIVSVRNFDYSFERILEEATM